MSRSAFLPALLLATLLPVLTTAEPAGGLGSAPRTPLEARPGDRAVGMADPAVAGPGAQAAAAGRECFVYFVVRARPAMYFSAPQGIAASGRRGTLFPDRSGVEREYQRFLERLSGRRRLTRARGGPAGVNSCDSRSSAEMERQKTAREMRAAGWRVELLR